MIAILEAAREIQQFCLDRDWRFCLKEDPEILVRLERLRQVFHKP